MIISSLRFTSRILLLQVKLHNGRKTDLFHFGLFFISEIIFTKRFCFIQLKGKAQCLHCPYSMCRDAAGGSLVEQQLTRSPHILSHSLTSIDVP